MLGYSLTGYVAAVSFRTTRTLLVEGSTDKSAIARLIIELRRKGLLDKDDVVIDTAADIPNTPGGNRQRVEHIHAQVGDSIRFAALVDREFREFDLSIPIDHAPYHRVVTQNLFWTRGHSIENYFITLAIVRATLEQNHPEHLPANYVNLLSIAFPAIVRGCAAITLAAQGIHKLDRIQGIKLLDYWKVDAAGNLYADLGELQIILAARGVDASDCAIFATFWHFYMRRLVANDVRDGGRQGKVRRDSPRRVRTTSPRSRRPGLAMLRHPGLRHPQRQAHL